MCLHNPICDCSCLATSTPEALISEISWCGVAKKNKFFFKHHVTELVWVFF